MATEYLNEGATTFAASGWSGSGLANGNDYVVNTQFGPITAGLDQSALTGIESLWFKPEAVGVVGGNGNGNLNIDADGTGNEFIRNHGRVDLYLECPNKVEAFDFSAGSRNWLLGGEFEDITGDGGVLKLGASATCDQLRLFGGSGTIEYNATAITRAYIGGGTWTIKRLCTTLEIADGATVIYDPEPGTSHSGLTLNMHGGNLIWMDGAIPTIDAQAGRMDFSQARRSFTPGGTSFIVGGARFIENASVDLSNATAEFAYGGKFTTPLP